jgi:hypothetical protein
MSNRERDYFSDMLIRRFFAEPVGNVAHVAESSGGVSFEDVDPDVADFLLRTAFIKLKGNCPRDCGRISETVIRALFCDYLLQNRNTQ